MPEGLLYQQDFITAAEESALMGEIEQLPLEPARYRTYRARRRTASFGTEYDFATNTLGPAPALPPFLLPLRERAAQFGGTAAQDIQHALITQYRPGAQLGWHRDVGEFDIVVGVSLAGACRMRFRRYPPKPGARVFTLDIEPRSAYALRGEIRWAWQHSVAPTPALRYSITFRTRR